MAADIGIATFKYIDYDHQTAQFSLEVETPTAGNFAAQQALVDALNDAIVGITLGGTVHYDMAARTSFSGTIPTIGSAQRQIQWLVTYVNDVTGGVRTVRIPTANLSITDLLLPASNEMDLTSTEGALFVAAFEAVVLDEGDAVTVQKVEYLQ